VGKVPSHGPRENNTFLDAQYFDLPAWGKVFCESVADFGLPSRACEGLLEWDQGIVRDGRAHARGAGLGFASGPARNNPFFCAALRARGDHSESVADFGLPSRACEGLLERGQGASPITALLVLALTLLVLALTLLVLALTLPVLALTLLMSALTLPVLALTLLMLALTLLVLALTLLMLALTLLVLALER
jgi:hypothetical protein